MGKIDKTLIYNLSWNVGVFSRVLQNEWLFVSQRAENIPQLLRRCVCGFGKETIKSCFHSSNIFTNSLTLYPRV